MMSFSGMILLLFSFAVLFLFYELYWKRRNLPPGPAPVPFIGNVVELFKDAPGYNSLIKWRKQYGAVYTYWIGGFPIVSINDYETIKRTVIKEGDKYADRPDFRETQRLFRGGNGSDLGVIDAWGEKWRDQRRFALHTMRDFGMGRNLMEERVLVEVEALLDRLDAREGEQIRMNDEFDIGVGSIINNILFGYRFDESRLAEFHELKEKLTSLMQALQHPAVSLILFSPWLRHLPYMSGYWKKLMEDKDRLYENFRRQMQILSSDMNYDISESTTFVESFLKEQKRRENEPECGGFSNLQLENVLFDLWAAGMDTTSNTLTWAVVYLLHNRDVQSRVQRELDEVIQGKRVVTMRDKNNLPYTNATVSEIQRLANLIPQNLFHAAAEDLDLDGYRIPKGTMIIPQISVVLYDDKVFPEPLRFDPQRFLSADGSLRKVDELIPFSIGKRQCLGASLAQMELFLFVSNLLNRFELTCASLPSTEKTFGFTMRPQPFTCTAVSRQ